MKYYILSQSTDPALVGDFPQLTSFSLPYQVQELYSTKSDGPLPYDFKLPSYFTFNNNAKVCDYLTSNYFGFRSIIISESMYSVLELFKIDAHDHMNCPIKYKNKLLDYLFVRFLHSRNEFIEWNNSEWYIIEDDPNYFGKFLDVGVFKPHDQKHFTEISKTTRLTKKIISFDKNIQFPDMFLVDNAAAYGIIVSTSLKEELERQKISGIRFINFMDERRVMHFPLNEHLHLN